MKHISGAICGAKHGNKWTVRVVDNNKRKTSSETKTLDPGWGESLEDFFESQLIHCTTRTEKKTYILARSSYECTSMAI